MPHLPSVAPAPKETLTRRQDAGSATVNSETIFSVIGGIAVVVILILVAIHYLRQYRIAHADPPRWIPSFLHQRYRKWRPVPFKSSDRSSSAFDSISYSSQSINPSGRGSSAAGASDVDRRQSVRSILTLPPYRISPLPDERLVAREGERAGVDLVVDLPETEDEAESRREDEMQALYNVREARRREQTEREDRREQRRIAAENQDWQRLDQLEQESRDRARQRSQDQHVLLSTLTAAQQADADMGSGLGRSSPNPSSQFLIAELQSLRETNARSRRVSSVSYAELGLARHDGSRLRGDSVESSDHRPLLDSAASFGSRSRAVSRAGSDTGHGRAGSAIGHGRSVSAASVTGGPGGGMSGDVGSAIGGGFHEPSERRDHSRTGSSNRPAGHVRHFSEAGASILSEDSNPRSNFLSPQNSADLPPPHPPSYEDDISVHGGEAPPYESPVSERHPETGVATGPAMKRTAVESDEQNTNEEDDEMRSAAHAAAAYVSQERQPLEPLHTQLGNARAAQPPILTPIVEPASASPSAGSFRSALASPALSRLQIIRAPAPALEVTSATPVAETPSTPIGGR